MQFNKGVIIRHCEDESLIWSPITGGCVVMRDCEVFLEEIAKENRDTEELVKSVSARFGVDSEQIRGDLELVLGELLSQGLVKREDVINGCDVSCRSVNEGSGKGSPEGLCIDFCKKYRLPVELHLDLTNACTERCVHCYVPKGQCDFLPFELVEKVLIEFRGMNGLTVHLTGGESMLHPDFERICRKCAELNLNIIILSNLTLCDDDRIAFINEVGPQFINVSLYSMTANEHDAITQMPGSWQKTMSAIRKCRASGICCRIATPILKMNADAIPALNEFADKNQMLLVPEYGIVAQADHCCENLDHSCSAEELRQMLARDHAYFRRGFDGAMPSCDEKVCDIGESRIFVSAKGNYYACDMMHDYVIGKVEKDNLREVWYGEKLAYLRKLKNRDFKKCTNCDNRPWCKVCPSANYNATRDLFTPDSRYCEVSRVVREVYEELSARGS